MGRTPKVILSWAQSADGRIATATGESKYLSSPESLGLQQELRRDCDAVLVGVGTVISDDPRLLCRLAPDSNPLGRQPLRVVLDAEFRTPTASVLARSASPERGIGKGPVLVVGAPPRDPGAEARRELLRSIGVGCAEVRSQDEGDASGRRQLDLGAVLELLAEGGAESLFVEGGAAVITSFLKADLADRIILDIAPRFIGNGLQAVGELEVRKLSDARSYRGSSVEARGGNLLWTLERARAVQN